MSENKLQFTRLSWNEYGELIDKLYSNVSNYLTNNNLKLDAIVVILREGGFVGLPLSYKFNTYKVIPIQFKYKLNEGGAELMEMADLPALHYELPENPVLLVVDCVASCGKTGIATAKKLKERFNNPKLIYASLLQDYKAEKPADYEVLLYAIQTDEDDTLSEDEAKNLGVDKNLYLLPWENEEEEGNSINQKEYNYN